MRRGTRAFVVGVFVALAACGLAYGHGSVTVSGGAACPTNSTTTGGGSYWQACNTSGSCGSILPTPSEACASLYPQYGGGVVNVGTSSSPQWRCTNAPTGGSSLGNAGVVSPQPAPSQTCTCNAGYAPSGSTCVSVGPCQTLADGLNTLGSPVQSASGVGGLTVCYGGCVMASDFGGTGTNNTWWLFAPFRATGANCQGSTNSGTDATAPPMPCPTGQCPGTVNGASVCVACGSTTSAGPTSTTTQPSGAASAPPGSAPPGTTTEQTTCTGGNCTTIQTTTNSSGQPVTQTTTTESEGSYCQRNPSSPQCTDDPQSSWGGGCGAFTCEGDAVQCAISREIHQRNCQLYDLTSTDPMVQAGNAGVAGGNQPSGHPALAPEAVAIDLPTRLDQTDRLGGSCPADRTISAGDLSVELPLSQLCTPAQWFRVALIGFSLFAAVGIVFLGHKG